MDLSSSMRKSKDLKLGLDQSFGEGKSKICSLPDSILHHILSFLDMKEAIKTSVLSKRWEFLWTSIPNLEFKEDIEPSDEKREEFMDFVERALLLRDSSSLHTFSLTCNVSSDGHRPRINSWIYAALRHKVKKMVLDLYFDCGPGSYMLPRHLFLSESLNELELDFIYDLRLPSSVYFPNLKILTLFNVIFVDDNSVKQLFSSCPNLVKLDLVRCKWHNLKSVYVSAPMLEGLRIFEFDVDVDFEPVSFMISGPRLKAFLYEGKLINEYCISEAPSLLDAHIDLDYPNSYGDSREIAYHALKLFEGLANMQYLYVSYHTFKALKDAEELVPNLPLFYNLNHLDVVTDDSSSMFHTCEAVLLKLLHNSPHLECISFGTILDGCVFSAQLDPVPPCFLTHLKTVKFQSFVGSEDELFLLKIILKSAKVLERIDLGYDRNNVDRNVILDLSKECMNPNVVFFQNSHYIN